MYLNKASRTLLPKEESSHFRIIKRTSAKERDFREAPSKIDMFWAALGSSTLSSLTFFLAAVAAGMSERRLLLSEHAF